jgi:RNA recognition motif-containing protein
MNIFVANLNFRTHEEELKSLFESYGEVVSSKIVTDRDSGRSKGFGFVEMAEESDGLSAVENLNGSDFNGRPLVVKKAEPRERQPRRY